ncbi:MAG: hypothetical protein K8W52_19980 [Deltaproteobacteria bacterium]|nr:hypothetical protein [Deltaproteobacteria bacterium]
MQLRPALTPRDRLDALLDYARRTLRYWWVAAAMVVVGGALSTLYALRQQPLYASESVLVHRQRIQAVVLGGRDAETEQRNLGDRYRELLLSRKSLSEVILDEAVSPFPKAKKPEEIEEAADEMRSAIVFKSRGANTFRITYSDTDPKRAQKVTQRLTEVLIHAETRLRQESAQDTVDFARKQKNEADEELQKRDRAYSEFLSKHPEFARESTPGGSEGAAIRASQKPKPAPAGNPRVAALQRQIDRLRDVLAAPDGAPPPAPPPRTRTPEQLAALALVDDAKRQLTAAQRAFEDVRSRFTDKHPDYIKAQNAVTAAQAHVRDAQAAVPPDDDDPVPLVATGPIDRPKLQKELSELERQLAIERAKTETTPADTQTADDAKADAIVTLETQHKDLKRAVDEQRETVSGLSKNVFSAINYAGQQMAENSAHLEVVDEANEPLKPTGRGKKFVVIAGVILFGLLGGALALGLAILDDRLYRRADVERLDLLPVLAVIPPPPRRKAKK